MDSTLYNFSNRATADGDALLLKIGFMCRGRVELVERSEACIARSGQLIAESDQRMTRANGPKAVRAPVRAATARLKPIYDRFNRHALREQVRQTRARSERIFRQTRNVIARSRALLIEPI